jgi:serine/threonine protein kinase
MVMEFVRGETFHDLSDRLGPIAPPQAAHLCMQVLDALGHAHRAGVVHRDLKPANLMITDGGSIKVMDFGIARVLGTEHFTHGGYMMGTPAYMAPEQVLGRSIDGRADLYSVGVVLYRLLSGRLPFNADTAISMVQMQISEAPTPILTFRPDLPAWCVSILERALAKSPSDRFQSAEEFRSALLAAVTPQALGEMPTIATPTPPGLSFDADRTAPQRTPPSARPLTPVTASGTATIRTAVPANTPAPTPTGIPSAERTGTTVVLGRTHLAGLAALIVILGIGVAVLAFAVLRDRTPRTPAQIALGQDGTSPVATPPPASSTLPAPETPTTATTSKPSTPAGVAGTSPTPPQPGGVATAGSNPGATKPAGRATGPAATPATRTDLSPEGRGAVPAANTTPTPTMPTPAAVPMVSFNQVRVLVNEGEKAREREGVLQIGNGQVALLSGSGGAPIMSVPTTALKGMFYARSKQPKWRDASGKEVEGRIDLGRMGFLRGERNWVILFTNGEPVILRFEDSALRTALPALEQATGQKIQR